MKRKVCVTVGVTDGRGPCKIINVPFQYDSDDGAPSFSADILSIDVDGVRLDKDLQMETSGKLRVR